MRAVTGASEEHDEDLLTAVREGEADLAAGRTYTCDQVLAAMKAAHRQPPAQDTKSGPQSTEQHRA